MHNTRKGKGFTLIELLIVVAIIAILALIAVPNFLEAQTRARIGRVMSDMRSLGTALESYRIDYNGDVPPFDSWTGTTVINRRQLLPGPFWQRLSSPVAYLTSPVRDAFVAIGARSSSVHSAGDQDYLDPYIQVGTGNLENDGNIGVNYYGIVSYGADMADDTGGLGAYPYTDTGCPYDPTNGTVSWGDIYRHSDRPPTNFVSSNNRNVGPPPGLTPWW